MSTKRHGSKAKIDRAELEAAGEVANLHLASLAAALGGPVPRSSNLADAVLVIPDITGGGSRVRLYVASSGGRTGTALGPEERSEFERTVFEILQGLAAQAAGREMPPGPETFSRAMLAVGQRLLAEGLEDLARRYLEGGVDFHMRGSVLERVLGGSEEVQSFPDSELVGLLNAASPEGHLSREPSSTAAFVAGYTLALARRNEAPGPDTRLHAKWLRLRCCGQPRAAMVWFGMDDGSAAHLPLDQDLRLLAGPLSQQLTDALMDVMLTLFAGVVGDLYRSPASWTDFAETAFEYLVLSEDVRMISGEVHPGLDREEGSLTLAFEDEVAEMLGASGVRYEGVSFLDQVETHMPPLAVHQEKLNTRLGILLSARRLSLENMEAIVGQTRHNMAHLASEAHVIADAAAALEETEPDLSAGLRAVWDQLLLARACATWRIPAVAQQREDDGRTHIEEMGDLFEDDFDVTTFEVTIDSIADEGYWMPHAHSEIVRSVAAELVRNASERAVGPNGERRAAVTLRLETEPEPKLIVEVTNPLPPEQIDEALSFVHQGLAGTGRFRGKGLSLAAYQVRHLLNGEITAGKTTIDGDPHLWVRYEVPVRADAP